MNDLQITKRPLTPAEIQEIASDIRSFPDLAYIKPSLFSKITATFVASIDGIFAGFCGYQYALGWYKLGPIAVKSTFAKHGVGKALLQAVLTDLQGKPSYFGTSNATIKEFGKRIGAVETPFWKLPRNIKFAVMYFLWEYFSVHYLYEGIRKRLTYGRAPYRFYLLREDSDN